MKKRTLGILTVILGVAALLLGTISYAASGWIQKGSTYECRGNSQAVFCKETNWSGGVYTIALFPGTVAISYKGKIIAFCERKHQPGPTSCTYRYQYGG